VFEPRVDVVASAFRRISSDEFWAKVSPGMTRTTTRITSVSLQVADQNRALAFYTDTLGCELRADVELWPGARWVEVVQALWITSIIA